jgi:hypothetical protein
VEYRFQVTGLDSYLKNSMIEGGTRGNLMIVNCNLNFSQVATQLVVMGCASGLPVTSSKIY